VAPYGGVVTEVLWPHGDGDLGRWMQWLLTTHVHGYRAAHHSSGHVWQGRFKAFAIEEDHHLLTVLRYVERNPLRAGLVERAEDWPWSSLRAWRQLLQVEQTTFDSFRIRLRAIQ
jgi:putative transposase